MKKEVGPEGEITKRLETTVKGKLYNITNHVFVPHLQISKCSYCTGERRPSQATTVIKNIQTRGKNFKRDSQRIGIFFNNDFYFYSLRQNFTIIIIQLAIIVKIDQVFYNCICIVRYNIRSLHECADVLVVVPRR